MLAEGDHLLAWYQNDVSLGCWCCIWCVNMLKVICQCDGFSLLFCYLLLSLVFWIPSIVNVAVIYQNHILSGLLPNHLFVHLMYWTRVSLINSFLSCVFVIVSLSSITLPFSHQLPCSWNSNVEKIARRHWCAIFFVYFLLYIFFYQLIFDKEWVVWYPFNIKLHF